MFGYVRPRKDQLRICDYDRYRAAYCGLCRSLGKRCGFFSRFFVNYDMTFLYFLLSCTQKEETVCKCVCPANVFCKKNCYAASALYDRISALTVILCRYQLSDAIRDKSFFKGLPYRFARALTSGAYKKAAKSQPAFDKAASDGTKKLSSLEAENCPSIDAPADAFASILRSIAADISEPELRRPTEQVLYHVGRFIYLTDALDDLSDDCKHGQYNPLRYRFELKDGALSADDLAQLRNTLEGSVSLAAAALELLPMRSGEEILKNIIYLGLPAVLQAAADGSFRSRAKI